MYISIVIEWGYYPNVKPLKQTKMKNYQAILMIIIGFGLSIGTMNGFVQNYIGFAGVDNEMAFSFMGMMFGTLGIVGIDYKKLLNGLK